MTKGHKFDPKHIEILDSKHREEILPKNLIISAIESICSLNGKTIADIGAGTGYFSIPFLEKVGENGEVIAADISDEMLRVLTGKINSKDNLWIVHSTEENIPISDSTVDLAFCCDLLHELSGSGTLHEVLRILKKDGYFLVIDWDKKQSDFGPPLHVRIPKEKGISICKDLGFVFIKEFYAGKYHYGLAFRKSQSVK